MPLNKAVSDSINLTSVNSKGDLLVGLADDIVSRLGVGNDNFVLTADSTQVTGLKWSEIPTTPTIVSAGSYKFDTNIVDSDPGSGFFKYNSSTISLVTFIYIDNLDNLGNSKTAWYDLWDDSTDSVKGFITIQEDLGNAISQFRITGNVTAATGYYKIPVAFISGSSPTNNTNNIIGFSRTGNIGAIGPTGPSNDRGGVRFSWSNFTNNSDPGNGFFKYNNSVMTNVTQIYIDNVDASGVSVVSWYDSWGTPTSQNKGYLIITGNTGVNLTNVFLVNGTPQNQSTHYLIPVQYVSGSLPVNNNSVILNFSSVGVEGPTGPSAGPTGPTGPAGTANYQEDQAVLAQRIFI